MSLIHRGVPNYYFPLPPTFFFGDRVSCISECLLVHYVAEDDLEFLIFLALHSKYWNYITM